MLLPSACFCCSSRSEPLPPTGASRCPPDALAALQRRYIGYKFTSRHPKGQISSGEIRDVILVANELVAKIKWKGQRAIDVQKLADLIGIPQRELEASAARDATDYRSTAGLCLSIIASSDSAHDSSLFVFLPSIECAAFQGCVTCPNRPKAHAQL